MIPCPRPRTSGAEAQPPAVRSHGVLVGARFADLETRLDQLGEALGLFLPLWLGRLPVGGRTWIDLSQPPAQTDPALLAQLDTWLLEGGAAGSGLVYTAPRGVLNSTRRLVALTGPLPRVQAEVQANLDLFRRRLQDVMSAAVETGAGFLVDTGLEQLRADEQAFLALGAGLDFWHWCGPPGARGPAPGGSADPGRQPDGAPGAGRVDPGRRPGRRGAGGGRAGARPRRRRRSPALAAGPGRSRRPRRGGRRAGGRPGGRSRRTDLPGAQGPGRQRPPGRGGGGPQAGDGPRRRSRRDHGLLSRRRGRGGAGPPGAARGAGAGSAPADGR